MEMQKAPPQQQPEEPHKFPLQTRSASSSRRAPDHSLESTSGTEKHAFRSSGGKDADLQAVCVEVSDEDIPGS